MKEDRDVLVVGGGIIGLTSAWHLARAGYSVTVLGADLGQSAAWVAAGMLAPASEAHFGEQAHVKLLDSAAKVWPLFVDELERETTESVGYLQSGTLLVGFDGGDKSELERSVEFQRSLGYNIDDVELVTADTIEPELSRNVRVIMLARGDHHVNPRLVLQALRAALDLRGVTVIDDHATGIEVDSLGVAIETQDGTVRSRRVLLALGASTSLLRGIDEFPVPAIRPVKGHVLRLFGTPLLSHTIRAIIHGRAVYLVQRPDGELVIGASAEEKGFDLSVQAGEVFRLLNDARMVVPGIDELELRETSCGLRPAPRDNLPVVDWLLKDQIAVATGHYRNGVLLAPLTGQVVTSLFDHANDSNLALFGMVDG